MKFSFPAPSPAILLLTFSLLITGAGPTSANSTNLTNTSSDAPATAIAESGSISWSSGATTTFGSNYVGGGHTKSKTSRGVTITDYSNAGGGSNVLLVNSAIAPLYNLAGTLTLNDSFDGSVTTTTVTPGLTGSSLLNFYGGTSNSGLLSGTTGFIILGYPIGVVGGHLTLGNGSVFVISEGREIEITSAYAELKYSANFSLLASPVYVYVPYGGYPAFPAATYPEGLVIYVPPATADDASPGLLLPGGTTVSGVPGSTPGNPSVFTLATGATMKVSGTANINGTDGSTIAVANNSTLTLAKNSTLTIGADGVTVQLADGSTVASVADTGTLLSASSTLSIEDEATATLTVGIPTPDATPAPTPVPTPTPTPKPAPKPTLSGNVAGIKIKNPPDALNARLRAKVSVYNDIYKTVKQFTASVYVSDDAALSSDDVLLFTFKLADYFHKGNLLPDRKVTFPINYKAPAQFASYMEGKYLIVSLDAANLDAATETLPIVSGPIKK